MARAPGDVISGTAVQRKKLFKQPAHVHIINYEAMRSHSRLAPYGSIALKRCIDCGGEDPKVTTAKCQVHERELNLIPYRTVIADEAHRIEGPDLSAGPGAKAAVAGAEFRFAMTGTPIANNIIDLWSILNFVDPVEWPSKTRWIDHMVDVVTNVFGGLVSASVRGRVRGGVPPDHRPADAPDDQGGRAAVPAADHRRSVATWR